MHNHSCAFSGFTFYFNRSSFVSHDAINRGESQAISLSRFLGGKKGLEHAGAGCGVHAATGVTDGERDPGVAEFLMPVAFRSGPITISRVERDAAAVGHGIARVQYQVQDDLLDLGWIHPYQAQIIREFGNQFDVLANQAAEQIADVRYDVIHAEQTGLDRPLPRHRHQLLDEPRALLTSLADLLRETP